ncbi:hypothetical protein A9Q81_12785 [Gammaproteobacteria bacterium 42_54_T18]|nr:hypothetical protein A9Q81_12785 [Gammaproteobacteria bacterium 42_54_T18]
MTARANKAPILFVLALLVFTVTSHTGENVQARLLELGSHLWGDYVILRADLPIPRCDPNQNISVELARLERDFPVPDPDDLIAEVFDKESTKTSLEKQRQLCQKKHAIAEENHLRVTPPVIAFRAVETFLTRMALFAVQQERVVLILLLFSAAAVTTTQRHHIAFRPIVSMIDHRTSCGIQLIGNLLLLVSSITHQKISVASGIEDSHPEIAILIIVGFFVLTLLNVNQLIRPPKDLQSKGSIPHALLTIPIYSIFCLVTCYYFMIGQNHVAGPAILFGQIFELSGIFINIGLYIWIGMLLKQTRLGELIFRTLTPWKLPPELLALAAIIIMALPTAYTGASGIIIIAMGTVVYTELTRIGARRQLALAATAMTGSSGVVLQPCLLVIAIAMLNKEVVTDELFFWGARVFLVTFIVFFIVVFFTKKEPMRVASPSKAIGPMMLAMRDLVPYIGIFGLVLVVYGFSLKAYLDQFSAPIILPVVIIAIIIYERVFSRDKLVFESDHQRESSVKNSLFESVNGATIHIGAILMVMACSFAVAGIIQRSGLFDSLPTEFSSIWIAMFFLVVVLVFIGMIMDAFGALILVSTSVAGIAYQNGIHPVHFWMVVLVAFELGYLTPPVALNHLLTRQVVGEEAYAPDPNAKGFWYKNERILLPLTVMAITLILVAFGPLIYQT